MTMIRGLAVVCLLMQVTSIVAPDPGVPLTQPMEVSFEKAWFGGFIGTLRVTANTGEMIPIDEFEITVTSRRKLFDLQLEGCDAELDSTDDDKNTFIFTPGPEHTTIMEGETLEIKFVAKTWKKVRGPALSATIEWFRF